MEMWRKTWHSLKDKEFEYINGLTLDVELHQRLPRAGVVLRLTGEIVKVVQIWHV